MGETPQRLAVEAYRQRLAERGMTRFEVVGRAADRALLRMVARCLADDGAKAAQLRLAMSQTIAGPPPKSGGILAALRRSPLVGEDLDTARAVIGERAVAL